MEAEKNELKVLEQALDEWQKTGRLTPEKTEELRGSITTRHSERQQIAQYFFFIALFCTLPAFGAIFLNEKLLERLKVYFSLSNLIISLTTAAIAIAWFWYVGKKRKTVSATAYEVYMVLGGLAVLTSIVYLCKELGIDKTYTAYLSLSLPVLATVAILLRSKALWIMTLITAIGWFGAWSTWLSSGNLFLGMNYPMRYSVFGLLILGFAFAQDRIKAVSFSRRITYTAGLLVLFSGLWGVSVFGNYYNLGEWQQVRQVRIVAYSVLFALASVISFLLGVRYKDDLARDMGVLFLLVNLYTRYFEFFWDTMNKGIFFLVLAVTFGLVGWLLERKARKSKNL